MFKTLVTLIKERLQIILNRFKSGNLTERKYQLLQVSLLGITILSFSLTIILGIGWIIEGGAYNGTSPIVCVSFSLVFLVLWWQCKPANCKSFGIFLITLLCLAAYGMSLHWGVDVPQSLLIYSLSISVCGMLFGAKGIVFVFLAHGLFLICLAPLQAHHLLSYTNNWRYELVSTTDGMSIVVMLFIISLASYVFNKQVELADEEVHNYADQLLAERNLLEKEVLKRTEQLRTAHLDRIYHLYRLAELGKTSAGLLHDIAQPVTAAFLSLHDINNMSRSKPMRHQLQITNQALTHIEQYIVAARRQVNQHSHLENLVMEKVIQQNCLLFQHQLKKLQIRLSISCHHRICYLGDPAHFSPILGNLIANAIDACASVSIERRAILISVKKHVNNLLIEISDTGSGIDNQHLPHIFEPFYSTKDPKRGIGLGLPQVKNIVTETMGGQLTVRSQPDAGTTFSIKLPIAR